MEAVALDPEGHAARANRRNNAETGNHAFKAILRDQIFSKDERAQRNEILCIALAYNLTRRFSPASPIQPDSAAVKPSRRPPGLNQSMTLWAGPGGLEGGD